MKRVHLLVLVSGLMIFGAAVAIADNVTFAYQGRVKVHGEPFTGTGNFKLAVMNTSGSSVLWSNNGTLSGEPADSIPVPVSEGIFNITVGDTAAGMAPLDGAIFSSKTPLKLRVWFDGGSGFQQLVPDQNLVDLTLNTVQTGLNDFTIYVNGESGNDSNNGLKPQAAKKTVQAAVDILPDRIRCNVTIDVAPGIYREMVRIYGITVDPIKQLKLLGDKTWTTTSTAEPAVRITGCDNDVTHGRAREYAIRAQLCSGIVIEGFLTDWCMGNSIDLRNGSYAVTRCKAVQNGWGIAAQPLTYVEISHCIASQNVYHGLVLARSSEATMTTVRGDNNGMNGLFCHQSSYIQFFGNCSFSNNTEAGMNFGVYASASFWAPGSFVCNNNGTYPITVGWNAAVETRYLVTMEGNGSGNYVYTFKGGTHWPN